MNVNSQFGLGLVKGSVTCSTSYKAEVEVSIELSEREADIIKEKRTVYTIFLVLVVLS